MNTFSLVQRALDDSAKDTSKDGLNAGEIEVGRIVTAVQVVVDALTPPDGGRYIVGFSNISTAQTSLGERRITVSSKPLHDRSLTMVEKAVVIATFAAHEIGHTLVTAPRKGRIVQHNPHSGFHAVANLADDIILEPVMADRFPILRDAFEFTGLWVLRSTRTDLPVRSVMSREMSTPDRFNVLLNATRYGDIPEIVWPRDVDRAERTWSRAWSDRLISARLDDHDTFLALCDEAWERIRSTADAEPEPPVIEPPVTDGGDEPDDEPGDEQGEGEGEGGSDEGESESDDGEDGESEGDDATDGDDGSEGEDEDGEDGEDGDEPTGESDGESQPTDDINEAPRDWDDDDESEGDGKDEGNGPVDSESPDEESTSEAEPEDDGSGGSGNPLRDESEFDKREVEESMHDQTEPVPYDWDAQRVEEQARRYASTTVTAFGKHGMISTTWS